MTARAGRRKNNASTTWAVTLGIALLAAALVALTWRRGSVEPAWVVAGALCVAIAATTQVSLRFTIGRQTIANTATDIPFVLALFFLPPFWAVIVRLAASVVVYGVRYVTGRQRLVQFVFNVVSQTAGAACAGLLVLGLKPDVPTDPATWAALLLAVLLSGVVTATCVTMVITVAQGWGGIEELLRSTVASLTITLLNGILGVLVILILSSTPWAGVLLAVLMAAIVAAYRGFARLQEQRRSLSDLNDFTRAVTESTQSGRLIDVMLGRVRSLLGAESATVWVPADARFPELLLSARLDDRGLIDTSPVPENLRHAVFAEGATLFVSDKIGDPELRSRLDGTHVRETIIVPMRSGKVVFGCLAVTNKLGSALMRFSDADQTLLETLTAHVGVAVENSRLVDRLRFDAYHDSLTRLPNRRRSMLALEESISREVPGEFVAVLVFDVDGMREVNDSLGFAAGDELLIEVARRLRELAPESAHVGRIGGDEFAVIFRTADTERALELARGMRTGLQQPFALGNLDVDVDAAVGVAVHPEHGDSADGLLQRADVATYAARNVSSGVQLFNVGLESRSVRRLGLASDLRRAFDTGELSVHYQPKIDLASRTVLGVECLARWHHPTHGEVPPEDFVPVAEHTGQLARLTEFVLRAGLKHARDWAIQGRPLTVAVNLSPRTVADPEFPTVVDGLLAEYGVPPERLTLEITEDGMVGDPDRPLPTLHRLHELGVRLSVDDFGTGYSSLSYLRRLPVHEVKIDRGFVQGMATDAGDLAIVRAVVDLSRHFGLSVVAEGVESEMTLALLTEIGCDIGQGFLFSRPLSSERLEAWLNAQAEESAPATELGEDGNPVRRLRAI
ncbi:putative bifunctional diguanylate cyclase/phosphodiesterase [Phytomonospora endophytica]|uniref:Diguanylate cyclase (GGDEF)-like protein n=1 Tax=Phytomonospora endophytica TaxID=714109 RepID=A0A841FU05_9ACTN|nr:GGDEF domain-containing protein [Phytomonospora endophytica]MBB6037218.1 diguanylate cyclase (GGDEF)-like protein [Phytomonospora endophytica]GIG71281.1 bifunctional diguanylate cyclase/phosphodiesterase [Phytomonospora endophytica]